MRLFGRQDDDPQAAEREASLAALERGGLPAAAEQRLRERATTGTAFSSTFSVDEHRLLGAAGVQPLSLVLGSSVYHVGWQRTMFSSWTGMPVSTELEVLSQAWNRARELAFGRLAQDARVVGAHAVVGVDVVAGAYDWLADAIEYVVTGTAVRFADAPTAADPVLTDLDGQELVKLRQAGYEPVGVVGGSTVHYVVPGWQTQTPQNWGYANQELTDFTQGVYDARETALERVTRAAAQAGADGVVGVRVNHSVEPHEIDSGGSTRVDLLITFHVLGTAVRASATDVEPPQPSLTLPLTT